MATKMCFRVNENKVFDEEIVTFTYVKGMAFSQKCKNVLSFHSSIQEQFPTSKILDCVVIVLFFKVIAKENHQPSDAL